MREIKEGEIEKLFVDCKNNDHLLYLICEETLKARASAMPAWERELDPVLDTVRLGFKDGGFDYVSHNGKDICECIKDFIREKLRAVAADGQIIGRQATKKKWGL